MRATRFEARALVDNILYQVIFFSFSFFFFPFLLVVCFYSLLQDNNEGLFSTRTPRSCTFSHGTRKPADFILSHGSEMFNNNNKNGDISRCAARRELAASLTDIHVNPSAEHQRNPGESLTTCEMCTSPAWRALEAFHGFVLWIYVLFIRLDVCARGVCMCVRVCVRARATGR